MCGVAQSHDIAAMVHATDFISKRDRFLAAKRTLRYGGCGFTNCMFVIATYQMRALMDRYCLWVRPEGYVLKGVQELRRVKSEGFGTGRCNCIPFKQTMKRERVPWRQQHEKMFGLGEIQRERLIEPLRGLHGKGGGTIRQCGIWWGNTSVFVPGSSVALRHEGESRRLALEVQ